MAKKLLTTDNARDPPSCNIALVQEYIGLDRAQFTSALAPNQILIRFLKITIDVVD